MCVISMQHIAFVATCVTSVEMDAGFCVARDVSVVHIRDGGEALLLKKKFSMTEEELCNESIQRKTSAQRCPHGGGVGARGRLGPLGRSRGHSVTLASPELLFFLLLRREVCFLLLRRGAKMASSLRNHWSFLVGMYTNFFLAYIQVRQFHFT